MGDATHVASETINGYEEVKSFGGEELRNRELRIVPAITTGRQNLKLRGD